jgi:hypothetical protein
MNRGKHSTEEIKIGQMGVNTWYTHKTSSYITSSYKMSIYKTSSYKMSIYQTSSYRMSRLQNVHVTKRPGYQTSILQNVQITKRPGHKTSSFCKFKNLMDRIKQDPRRLSACPLGTYAVVLCTLQRR